MQKKLIALAVVSMMSGAAFAQSSSVTLGGKFDACYAFTRAGTQAAKTTEMQTDGCNTSSRVTVGAKETIAPGYDVRVDYDIRFGNVHEGKSGLSSNDKKAMAFTTPFGTMQWGTANLMSGDFKLAEKPYMVNPKDTELVKHGVAQFRESTLTARNTSYWSPVLKVGPFEALVKGSFAFGDVQKAGGNDASTANSGNVIVLGTEGRLFGGVADYGIDVTKRGALTSEGGDKGGSMVYNHFYLNVRPLPGNKSLKLTTQYNVYKGWETAAGALATTGTGSAFKDKNTAFIASYNFNDKAEIGLGVSHLNGVGDRRYAARGVQLGGSYLLSKTVQVYAAVQKTSVISGAGSVLMKYDGNATNFAGTSTLNNTRAIKVGIAKEF